MLVKEYLITYTIMTIHTVGAALMNIDVFAAELDIA
jgi:hypothetical protein